ncbi:CrcB family protein [Curtobacterium sp. MCBD17_032]|uniref:fluoride efflux transporter FluC n=1 Tax=Curtobacterium sp. MCBD17_032 TaxID=2175659 RepID=UPI000DAA88C1|nr:CrcB family protein [Curtobacterium sp. MCBD17_032]PZE80427.1 CrcB family protein [Curtobacterium sp. MCBD17_032]
MDDRPAGRPSFLRAGPVALVALGGAVGTAIRAVLAAALPPVDGISWTVLGINVVGAFCLGLLLEHLAMRGPDLGRRRTARLFVGTGVLGGFTTYSTLADDTARLLDAGRWGAGSGYALLTVVLGLAAAVAGITLATTLRRRAAASAAPGTGSER